MSSAKNEFRKIVQLFMKGLQGSDQKKKWKQQEEEEHTSEGERLLKIVISQIRSNRIPPLSEDSLSEQTRDLTVLSLEVLYTILKDCEPDEAVLDKRQKQHYDDLLEKRQKLLDEMGGSYVALMMVSCMDDVLYNKGLDFAIMMLQHGNLQARTQPPSPPEPSSPKLRTTGTPTQTTISHPET